MRRDFPRAIKVAAFKRANGHCEKCTAFLYPGKFRYDHILPDGLGGEPTLENCQVICSACDDEKTPEDQSRVADTKRIHAKFIGAWPFGGARPLPGGKRDKLKRALTANGPRTERRNP